MSARQQSFFDRYSQGCALAADIHDAIDQWHESDSDLSLHEFLGLSRSEYAFWSKHPDKLHMILMARVNGFSLQEALAEERSLGLAARNCDEESMNELRTWLDRSNF